MILQAHAELAIDADHWFVRKAHAWRQRRLVAFHEIGPFVHVEPDAVARAVRQAGDRVAGAEAGCFDDGARGRVDILAGNSRLRRVERRRLGGHLQVPDLALPRCRVAEHVTAGDVGVIAFDRCAGIDQHHVALFERLLVRHAMRIGCRLAEQHGAERRRPVGAECLVGLRDEVFNLRRRDPRGQDTGRGFLHFQRDLFGARHQRDLRLGLDHAAGAGDVAAIDEIVAVAGLAQPVEGEERRRLVDGQGAAGGARVDRVDDQRRRVFMFLPAANVPRHHDRRRGLFDLEGGTDIAERPLRRDHRAMQPLPAAAAQAGEVVQAGRRIQIQGGDAQLPHHFLRLRDTRLALRISDRLHVAAHRAHRLQFGGPVGTAYADCHQN